MRRDLVAIAFLACVVACKKAPPTDDRPEVDRKQLEEEARRIAKGEVVGEPLRMPKIVVDAQQIAINGHRVTGRRDLEGAAMHRIDEVFTWMKGLREHWKTLFPAGEFDPKVDLTLPEDVTFVEGASLVKTLGFAGYPNDVTVRMGNTTITFDVAVPGPPRPDVKEEHPVRDAALEICKSGNWNARVSIGGAKTARSLFDTLAGDPSAPTAPWGREDFPADAPAPGGPWQPVTDGTMAEVARTLCGDGCTALALGVNGSLSFKDAMVMLAPALGAPKPKTKTDKRRLNLTECSTAPEVVPDAGARAPSKRQLSRLREGATSVNGRLPPEVIQRIVRQNFGRFRLCYENALRNNPTLQGRVATKFVIDKEGAVSSAQDGGSDLPDQGVVKCVVAGFRGLSFPQPEGGPVTVVYPIMFSPMD